MSNIIVQDSDDNPINWSPEKKKAIYRYLQNEEMQEFREIMSRSVERIEAEFVEVRQRFDGMEEEVSLMKSNLTDLAEKEYFVKRAYGIEWNSLESIGKDFNPSLNKKQMPQLLKKLGILQKYNNEPMAIYQGGENPLAIKKKYFDAYGVERWGYHYNADKLWKIVTSILERKGLLDTFLACKNKDQVWNFINSL